MQLKEKADIYVRLALASDKAAEELATQFDKWFAKWFVKGMNLAMLKSLHDGRCDQALATALAHLSDTDVISIIKKLDPSNIEILSKEKTDLATHIRALANGSVVPIARPKPVRKPKAAPGAKLRKPGGVLANARQG